MIITLYADVPTPQQIKDELCAIVDKCAVGKGTESLPRLYSLCSALHELNAESAKPMTMKRQREMRNARQSLYGVNGCGLRGRNVVSGVERSQSSGDAG